MWLGFGGVTAAGLAVVSSFGLCATIGVDFVSIVGVVPFLIMGKIFLFLFYLLASVSTYIYKTVQERACES